MNNPLAKISEHTKLKIMKWSYLVIVVAATITLAVVVRQNQILVDNIQNDRKQLTYDTCLEQNARHFELVDFVNERALKEAQEAAKKEGKPIPTEPPPMDPTAKKFIIVLAKVRDCDQLVINIFGSPIDESS